MDEGKLISDAKKFPHRYSHDHSLGQPCFWCGLKWHERKAGVGCAKNPKRNAPPPKLFTLAEVEAREDAAFAAGFEYRDAIEAHEVIDMTSSDARDHWRASLKGEIK